MLIAMKQLWSTRVVQPQSGTRCDIQIVVTIVSGIVHNTFSMQVTSMIRIYLHDAWNSTGLGIRSENQEFVKHDRDGAAEA